MYEKNGEITVTIAKPESSSIWQKVELYLNTLNHMVIATVTIYLSWFCFHKIRETERLLHVFLCLIGYQVLMAEAILTFYHANAWSRLHSRRTKANMHWIMQVIGGILSFVGCALEYSHHKRAHFSTWHGLSGLIAMIFSIFACVNGIAALWSVEFRKYVRPIYSKLFHTFFGAAGFGIGMLSIFYSYNTTTITNVTTDEVRYMLQTATAITGFLSLFGIFQTWYSQIKGLIRSW